MLSDIAKQVLEYCATPHTYREICAGLPNLSEISIDHALSSQKRKGGIFAAGPKNRLKYCTDRAQIQKIAADYAAYSLLTEHGKEKARAAALRGKPEEPKNPELCEMILRLAARENGFEYADVKGYTRGAVVYAISQLSGEQIFVGVRSHKVRRYFNTQARADAWAGASSANVNVKHRSTTLKASLPVVQPKGLRVKHIPNQLDSHAVPPTFVGPFMSEWIAKRMSSES